MRFVSMVTFAALAALVFGFATGPSMAADLDPDGAAWTDSDDYFFLDEDALFGSGGGLLTEVEATAGSAHEAAFLARRGVDFGGSYRFSAGADWAWMDGEPAGGTPNQSVRFDGTLYADVRPSRTFRAFAKVKTNAVLRDGDLATEAKLHELFADLDVADRVFLRIGKQTVNWGVGYFFSPADIINIGRLDPENPEADREGPTALRIHVPSGRNNVYGYVIIDEKDGERRVALAPKIEWVTGGTELGFGLYYRADRVPRAMATLSTSVGRVSAFGEATLSRGSDKRFVQETAATPPNPFGLEVFSDTKSWRVRLTAGARYAFSDPDRRYSVTAAGQYSYNGEGYDGEFLKKNMPGISALATLEQLSLSDVQSLGRHYGALSIGASSDRFKDLSPSVFWLGNLSDGSGMVTLSLGYSGWNAVRPTVSVSRAYGDPGSEFAPLRPATRINVGISIGGDF